MEIISESIFARELIENIIFVGLYFCKGDIMNVKTITA
jgi:hypothetical protein